MDVGPQIAARRAQLGFTLAQLAEKSGVSKAMLCDVEASKKNPTVRVLHQIALGLDCTISDLLDVEPTPRLDHIRREERKVFIDQESGIARHLLAPALMRHGIQVLFYHLPSGSEVEWAAEMPGVFEHITMLKGSMRLTLASETVTLHEGDSVTFAADRILGFQALGSRDVHLLLVMDSTQVGKGNGASMPAAPAIAPDDVGKTPTE
jgi:transcriptional regulator with XRE-family HTH domain